MHSMNHGSVLLGKFCKESKQCGTVPAPHPVFACRAKMLFVIMNFIFGDIYFNCSCTGSNRSVPTRWSGNGTNCLGLIKLGFDGD